MDADWSDSERLLLPLLSAIAGMVDVIGFLTLGLFPAHVTGNLVVIAALLIRGGPVKVAQILAVPVFAVAVAGVWLIAKTLRGRGRTLIRPLLAVQFLLLASVLVLAAVTDSAPEPHRMLAGMTGMIAVSAMACQFSLLRLAMTAAPSTAVMTGNVTNTVLALLDTLSRGQPLTEGADGRLKRTFDVLVGFLAGCVAGAAAVSLLGDWAWSLPVALAAATIALPCHVATPVAAVVGALVLAWAAPAHAQSSAPSPAPPPDVTPASQPAATVDEIVSRHLHVLTPQEPTPEGILAPEPPADVAAPQLRLLVPGLAEGMEQLSPFFRDTSLKLHLRSFYFNRLNSDGTRNEAWALGGWLAYRSGWLWDTFALGAVGYTSQPLHAPEDRGGTDLLHPAAGDPQAPVLVLGQAYAQMRYEEYALVTGYRQLVDEGYLNPHDSRMVPKTFEGATMKGTIGPIGYDGGYLTAIKLREDNDFQNMAKAAGVGGGKNRGLVLTRLSAEPLPGLSVYTANYLVPDVFNTAYGFGEYAREITPDLTLKAGLQATDQRSVGAGFLGHFKTWNVQTRAILVWRGLGFGGAFAATGDGSAVQTPYGDAPGYFTFQEKNFNEARQKAWGLAARYDFGPGTLIPGVRIPGLSVLMRYAEGRDAINATSGAGLPTAHEGDLDVIWNVAPGLQFRFRNAYVADGGGVLPAFRIILNYELPLL